MGMFFGGESKVDYEEFKRALWHLREDAGFSDHELDRVKSLFRGDLHESGDSAGISHHEIKKAIEWMKRHMGDHHFSEEKIRKIETAIKKYL